MNAVPPAEQVHAAPTESRALRGIYSVLGCVMLAGVLLNLANVIGRYAFAKPIFWAEEVLRNDPEPRVYDAGPDWELHVQGGEAQFKAREAPRGTT